MENHGRAARPVDVANGELDEVFALYRQNSSTLGFLPKGAFEEFGVEGRILVTHSNRDLDGYLAYRVAGTDAVIVHLCVRSDRRGSGVASALLEELFRQAAGLGAVRLSCREDYVEANKLWPRHGFICNSEKGGRGADGARLYLWRRKLSGDEPPLLAAIQESERAGRKTAVVDANVFFDFDDPQPRADESKALLADWLAPDVLIAATAEMKNELTRQKDQELRHQGRARLTSFQVLEGSPDDVSELRHKIETVLPPAVTESDRSDRRQLAHASATHADFFVTRDQELLDHADALEAALGLGVLRPSELVVHLHEWGAKEQYAPARLMGTHIRRHKPTTEEELAPFQRFGQAEPKASWVALYRRVFSNPIRYDTLLVEPPGAGPKVLMVLDTDDEQVLVISVLRALSHPLSGTLLRRVLSEVLVRAQEEGQHLVVCTDAGDPLVEAALGDLGFILTDEGFLKASIRDVVPLEDVPAALEGLGSPARELHQRTSAVELESQLWPMKVLGAEIPTFIVPIQPRWAAELFDVRLAEGQLFGAKPELALALENVYYSASKIDIPAGSRILWYVSKDKQAKVGEIRACSICQETVTGTPSMLFRKFARLGIYRWPDLLRRARGDHDRTLRAYRFALTERLPRPISYARLQEVLKAHQGNGNPCASPFRVPEEVFEDLYSEGTELVSDHAAVVVSIKPEYVNAIVEGRKKVELRRRFPSVKAGMWLVVYATLPVGAVVGMVPIKNVDRRPPAELWDTHHEVVGVEKSFFDDYFEGCDEGHAVELGEFQPLTPTSVEAMNEILPGFRPPQSYRYMGPRTLRRLLRSAGQSG